jgi:thiol-disulfide isomerase/thioredoxin
MKKKLLLLFFIIQFTNYVHAQGYSISLKVNCRSGIVNLAYRMGKSYYVQDSAAVAKNGTAIFKSTEKLQPGIYSIFFPGNRLSVDFLIDKEQNINIVADTNNIEKIQITGSPANIDFQKYQAYVNTKGKVLQQAQKNYNEAKTKADSVKYEAVYKKFNGELNTYRETIVKTKPNSMLAVLLKALREPILPDKKPVTLMDSLEYYYFYKDHYWDGITFMDDRIIRTPFFQPKLENYYRQVMPQAADSLIKDIDYKLLLARSSPEMYKYLLNWFTDEYLSPKYMGQDAVFVHLYQQYHSKGLSKWLNKAQDSLITRRAFMLMSNLIGESASNLEFVNPSGKVNALYDVNADFTLLVFWDPNCGHCKEEIPRIDSFYRAGWEKKGLKIYAVLSETEKVKDAWVKYIDEHKINDWINVYQSKEIADLEAKDSKPSYRQLYDISVTPTIYLLDKQKRIIAKKLTLEQLNDFLDVKIKNAGGNK